jgi:predicted unusual protein kinase regulating ubiquinone biosynthesis (AarF/ABC1/UbiB family)
VIAEVSAKRFAGVAFRQVRHARHGPLPLAVLAQPLRKTFEDLGGTYMKFGQLVASSCAQQHGRQVVKGGDGMK